jgi:SAM-dependent methyltransferase
LWREVPHYHLAVDPRLRAYLLAHEPSDEDFVNGVFAFALRREPEDEARHQALEKLAEGTLSRAALLHQLVTSEEFGRIRLLEDAVAFASGARRRGERLRRLSAPTHTDERVIEIPWVLSRLRTGRVLEVGYAFAEPVYLAALLAAAPGELVGVDMAEAEVPGMETVVADVRKLPFADEHVDQVLLVSTLEHIGADNDRYGIGDGRDTTGPRTALRELRRVLKADGSLLVTVPVGAPEDYGWFWQEDVRGWTHHFVRSGFFVEEFEVYELADNGWVASQTFTGEGVRYGERGPAASAVLCAELSPRRLRRIATPDGLERTLRRRLAPTYRRFRASS